MTRNNTSYRTKGRAVFLAAIMVLSMLALPVAFTGGVTAVEDFDDDEGDFEITDAQPSIIFTDEDSDTYTVNHTIENDSDGVNDVNATLIEFTDGGSDFLDDVGTEQVTIEREGDRTLDETDFNQTTHNDTALAIDFDSPVDIGDGWVEVELEDIDNSQLDAGENIDLRTTLANGSTEVLPTILTTSSARSTTQLRPNSSQHL